MGEARAVELGDLQQLGELPLAAPTLVRQFAELARREDPVDALTARCPCDGCRFAARCAVERCACEAFSVFVSGRSEPRWRLAPRAPTRARYESLPAFALR